MIGFAKIGETYTTVGEGYPSRAQDSAGLKKDKFVKIPSHKAVGIRCIQLNKMDLTDQGSTYSVKSGSEAKVNCQFPRITNVASYSLIWPTFQAHFTGVPANLGVLCQGRNLYG